MLMVEWSLKSCQLGYSEQTWCILSGLYFYIGCISYLGEDCITEMQKENSWCATRETNTQTSTETHPLVLNYQTKNLSTLEIHSICTYTLVTAEEFLAGARRNNLSHRAKWCENNWNQRGNSFRFLRTSKSLRQLTTMYSKLWFSSYQLNWAL